MRGNLIKYTMLMMLLLLTDQVTAQSSSKGSESKAISGSAIFLLPSGKDGKDNDTSVYVKIERRGDNRVLFEGYSNGIEFGGTNEIKLDLRNPSERWSIAESRVIIAINPIGRDHWDFDLKLLFKFEDGGEMTNYFPNHWLSEKNKINTYDLYPTMN